MAMGSILELEIKAIMHFLNTNTLLSSIVFNDKLLKEKESSLVIDSLSYLNLCDPQMRSISFFAIIALLILNNKFNDEGLL
jgi:hypothetical protein